VISSLVLLAQVVLDISPPPLSRLVIEGTLILNDTSANLTAVYIELKGGELIIASTDAAGVPVGPYTGRCIITLPGTNPLLTSAYGPDPRDTPALNLGREGVMMGTGVLGVFGRLTAIGLPVKHSWVPLTSPAAAGNTTLVVEGTIDWAVGAEVVVTPTDTDPHEAEISSLVAVDVAADGRSTTLRLAGPLRFAHLAGPTVQYGTRQLRMQSRVGLLTRNIVIRGEGEGENQAYTTWNAPSSATPASSSACGNGVCEAGEDSAVCRADCVGPVHEYGAAMLVSAYTEDYTYCTRESQCTVGFRRGFVGVANISNIEMRYFGQNNLRVGLEVSRVRDAGSRTNIVNMSFNRGYNGAVRLGYSSGVKVTGGTVYRAMLPAVEIGDGSLGNQVLSLPLMLSFPPPPPPLSLPFPLLPFQSHNHSPALFLAAALSHPISLTTSPSIHPLTQPPIFFSCTASRSHLYPDWALLLYLSLHLQQILLVLLLPNALVSTSPQIPLSPLYTSIFGHANYYLFEEYNDIFQSP
jgi:hypothetical protein